jgi:hypothetical protein
VPVNPAETDPKAPVGFYRPHRQGLHRQKNRGIATDIRPGTALTAQDECPTGEGFNQHIAARLEQGREYEAFGVSKEQRHTFMRNLTQEFHAISAPFAPEIS